MWDVTGWAAAVWLKWTFILAVSVGVAWLVLPNGSGWFWVICATAAAVEYFVTRQLGREWAHQVHFTWWGAR